MNIGYTKLLYGAPEEFLGSVLPETDMLAIAAQKFPDKKHITLKQWMIIDIVGSRHELEKILSTKKNPIIVYYSVSDNAPKDRLQEDDSSYSEYQVSYKDGLFETEETIYILMGMGFRTTINITLLSLLNKKT